MESNGDYSKRPPYRLPEAPGEIPRFFFVKTAAGPGEDPYPSEGDSPNVYYGRVLGGVSFLQEVGEQMLSYTETERYVHFYNMVAGDYIAEETVVCCVRLGNRLYTWDKVPCTGCGDGNVYAIGGGTGDASPLRDVDNFNADARVWKEKTDLPTPARNFLFGCAENDFAGAFVFGGNHYTTAVADCDEYDSAGDAWTAQTDIPAAMGFATGGAVGTTIYANHGTSRNNAYATVTDTHTAKATDASLGITKLGWSTGSYVHVASGYASPNGTHKRYDPGANNWTSRTATPAIFGTEYNSLRGVSFTLGDGAFIAGGDAFGNYTTSNLRYDFAANTWSTSIALPNRVSEPAACTSNAVAYVTGGIDFQPNPDVWTPNTLAFDGSTWTNPAHMLSPDRRSHASVSL